MTSHPHHGHTSMNDKVEQSDLALNIIRVPVVVNGPDLRPFIQELRGRVIAYSLKDNILGIDESRMSISLSAFPFDPQNGQLLLQFEKSIPPDLLEQLGKEFGHLAQNKHAICPPVTDKPNSVLVNGVSHTIEAPNPVDNDSPVNPPMEPPPLLKEGHLLSLNIAKGLFTFSNRKGKSHNLRVSPEYLEVVRSIPLPVGSERIKSDGRKRTVECADKPTTRRAFAALIMMLEAANNQVPEDPSLFPTDQD